ncbi:mTERF domain-containing protein [Cephalotus follicularis]|uniref:mTERF domain-containing protein n=1 Tax=Cephalotus follicularis TaxID=3775 RepID=A0A1Q3B7C8_CEPFO|nr:mTERF domain-containing protein [Cephalotus follicularis]
MIISATQKPLHGFQSVTDKQTKSKPEDASPNVTHWILDPTNQSRSKVRKKAQAAFLEYLHNTRSLQFTDAENISRNSPDFLAKLLKSVNVEADVGNSITRYLRYHPINEFEPFFESLGLKTPEYAPLLPRDLMFLSDDDLLLANYHVLCDYGIARNKIGKIFRESEEVFRYESGVLLSKLEAYEKLGLNQDFMRKVVIYSPYILIGGVNIEFVKVIEILKSVGLQFSWIEEHFSKHNYYNWGLMLRVLSSFTMMGCNEEQLGRMISQHPGLLFEASGGTTLSVFGFILKFGFTMDQMFSMFLQFPDSQVGKFYSNLRQCFMFLNEIGMKADETGKIFRSHPILLGSSALKKTNSLLTRLNVGKNRLCQYIQENPQVMKKWVMGSQVGPLPNSGENERQQMLKNKFLLDLGFGENLNKMDQALKVFRGKGSELQERFDCIVTAGLDRKEVIGMIRVSPQILNQKKDVIQKKIGVLVNDLGYPISSLVVFPSYLSYTPQRVNLRFSMYNWLKDQGKADPTLALSTIVATSENYFVRAFVNRHPGGPEVWQKLKKQICSN